MITSFIQIAITKVQFPQAPRVVFRPPTWYSIACKEPDLAVQLRPSQLPVAITDQGDAKFQQPRKSLLSEPNANTAAKPWRRQEPAAQESLLVHWRRTRTRCQFEAKAGCWSHVAATHEAFQNPLLERQCKPGCQLLLSWQEVLLPEDNVLCTISNKLLGSNTKLGVYFIFQVLHAR